MTSTPEIPNPDGADLTELREEIDELKDIPTDELVEPLPRSIEENEAAPSPTDAIGGERWDVPVEDESLDQQ